MSKIVTVVKDLTDEERDAYIIAASERAASADENAGSAVSYSIAAVALGIFSIIAEVVQIILLLIK